MQVSRCDGLFSISMVGSLPLLLGDNFQFKSQFQFQSTSNMAAATVDTSASYAVHPAPGSKDNDLNGVKASKLSDRKYMRWDAKGVEIIPPGEEEDINAVADQINHIQRDHYNRTRHAYGGTHARTQGVVKGTFVVSDDLPAHLKQTELFSKGGEYPAVCRYSTEPGNPGQDVRSS